MSLKPVYFLNVGLILGMLLLKGWVWYHDPQKFALQAPIYAVGYIALIWFVLAYQVITKFQRPGLGWAMVVLGITGVTFPYGRFL